MLIVFYKVGDIHFLGFFGHKQINLSTERVSVSLNTSVHRVALDDRGGEISPRSITRHDLEQNQLFALPRCFLGANII